MVTSVTSFSRNGLSDWLVQRVSSIVLAVYFGFVAVQLVNGIDYSSWKALHETTGMRVFTLLAVLSLAAHAWIGLWAVFTDYLTERMLGPVGNTIRLVAQLATVLVLIVFVLWVIEILWR